MNLASAVYTVHKRHNGADFWVRIGALSPYAFVNSDQKALVIDFDAFPVNGNLTMRPARVTDGAVACPWERDTELSVTMLTGEKVGFGHVERDGSMVLWLEKGFFTNKPLLIVDKF